MDVTAKRKELFDAVCNDRFVKEHKLNHTWISGSSTVVYPIQEWLDSVDIQWKSNRACDKWIKGFVEKHKDILSHGYFCKSDGSCPSYVCLCFYREFADRAYCRFLASM